MWNWALLPESEHAEIIAHVKEKRWSEVARICEQHGVSAFCCCNAEGLQNWVRWAIEQGIINAGKRLAKDTGRDGGTVVE